MVGSLGANASKALLARMRDRKGERPVETDPTDLGRSAVAIVRRNP